MTKEQITKSIIAPVIKTTQVNLPVAYAFKLFTEGIYTWWSLNGSHSIGEQDEIDTLKFEGRVGGRVYELHKDGAEKIWGTVQTYEAPHLFSMTWHPGNESELATLLEVRFTATDTGTTVQLTHSGWEARGEDGLKYRDGYDSGWDIVFGKYIQKTEK